MRYNRNFRKLEERPKPLSPKSSERLKLLTKLASPEVIASVKKDRKLATSREHSALHLYLTKEGLFERGSYQDTRYDITLGDMGRDVPCVREVNHWSGPNIYLVYKYDLSKDELECHLSMLGFK